MRNLLGWILRFPVRAVCLPAWFVCVFQVNANPTGGNVTHGSATFTSSGSTFNINQTSANAVITWQSFNVGQGETVNFNQPSASSVTWNQINGVNPSQILGNINANGYVILQNANGFVVGGSATLNTHGLVMTTASTPAVNFGGGGPWSFDAPPPTAKIVTYGQINITGGGSAYLIANDIENDGTISAPGGKIGLYAGERVLVSISPDGRGLSAEATIPQGLVDNNGNLIANAGSISLQAQMVNQDGLIQANSAQDVNGAIELIAGNSVNLGANSVISAQGDSQGVSSGGSVNIQAGNTFSDQAGSVINVSGGAQGGNGGSVEMSAPVMGTINSLVDGQALDGFTGGALTIDPTSIWLDSANTAPSGYTFVNINSFSGMSQINLQANNNITLNTAWSLAANLSLSAGNDITLNNGSDIQAGNGWNVSLTAGTAYSGATPVSGSDGIFLTGNAYLETQNGNINLWAANEVQVGWSGSSAGAGVLNSGTGSIFTKNGGNINVTAEFGDVNSGSSPNGFLKYTTTAPYDTISSILGGISTANGGNVTINAGGNVISFSAATVAAAPGSGETYGDPDPGTGCFGAAPGNVTINAGGSVYGCYVVMNGSGTINAQNIGTSANNVALSLATGGWNLNAQNSIYLQEVRNPNGLFNQTTASAFSQNPSAANHLFTYSPQAYLTLSAANAVYITGSDLSRPDGAVPMLLPPILNINAGPGGVVLDTPTASDGVGENDVTLSDYDITLFPSPYQSMNITTTGGGWLSSGSPNGTTLLMSDSAYTQWFNAVTLGLSIQPFGEDDHASVPPEWNNYNPAIINLSGSQLVNGVPVAASMENIVLQTDKATRINIAGDMIGCSFYGVNLHSDDVTSIIVGGQIYNAGSFTSISLSQGFPTLPGEDIPLVGDLSDLLSQGASLSSWYLPLLLAINPAQLPGYSLAGLKLSEMLAAIKNATYFGSLDLNGLVYNPSTETLTAVGPLASDVAAALKSPTLLVPRFDANGYPVLDANGHLVLDTINWASGNNANLITTLYAQSQSSTTLGAIANAYVVGGTGQFDVNAGSISLGNSYGILSVGDDDNAPGSRTYSFLAPYFTSAANINVTADYLEMPASTIACLGSGGNVSVEATGEIPNSVMNDSGIGVSMDLGSQALQNFETQIMGAKNLGLGIYTTGGGNVNVSAQGTINVDSSRIATFDGGNIDVVSSLGDVNAGSGGSGVIPISYYGPDYFGNDLEEVSANGIVAGTLTGGSAIPSGAVLLPGNITVSTPEGNISTSAGGISQVAYNEVLSASSGYAVINLYAGSPGYIGNLDLGDAGVFGINVNANATGNIIGKIFSVQNANINATGSFSGVVFSGGKTTLNAGGGSSGDFIALQGISGGGITGNIISTSVNGGAGTVATASTASSATQSAANQTSSQDQQQVASNAGDDDDKKKKKAQLRTIGRVTVLLNASS
ncbi:MAG TPA: filamentous hemagglutinin N-terminal domain-containing protein [Verrucomicrobiae bacterium]|nr:filamentous hemagglutinin N-terminal domain-containing protein [Verrucomicrobiae bacterium]